MPDASVPPRKRSRIRRRLAAGSRRLNMGIRSAFFAGLLVVTPIAVTVWVAHGIVTFFDRQMQALLPGVYDPAHQLPFSVPGIGLIAFFVGITAIGALTAGFLGRMLVRTTETVLARMPVIRTIYGAVKQLLETVLSQKSGAFREVVAVEYPRRGAWTLGFVSGVAPPAVRQATAADVVPVFVPTVPNPTSGFLIYLPRSEIAPLDMSVEDGFKLVLSSGLVLPPERAPRAGPAEAAEPATQPARM